jgi:hypothetical protein
MQGQPIRPPRFRFLGSTLGAKLAAIPVAAVLLFAGIAVTDHAPSAAERGKTICRQAATWRDAYGDREGLRVVRVDVHFRARADHFVVGEGVVATPVAIDLPGYQRVLDTAGVPAPVSALDEDDVHTVEWPYPGLLHHDQWFTALALVEPDAATPADHPSREELIASAVATYEATRRAEESNDHRLALCKPFKRWALALTAAATPEERLLAVASSLARRVEDFGGRQGRWRGASEGACAMMRADHLTAHVAQVLTVMAARELGVPSLAFTAAEPRRRYLVGMRADAGDWRLVDLADVDGGFLGDPPPLLAKAPVIGSVSFAQHGFWDPRAAAFDAGGKLPISYTTWSGGGGDEKTVTDSTEVSWTPLSELCS